MPRKLAVKDAKNRPQSCISGEMTRDTLSLVDSHQQKKENNERLAEALSLGEKDFFIEIQTLRKDKII